MYDKLILHGLICVCGGHKVYATMYIFYTVGMSAHFDHRIRRYKNFTDHLNKTKLRFFQLNYMETHPLASKEPYWVIYPKRCAMF